MNIPKPNTIHALGKILHQWNRKHQGQTCGLGDEPSEAARYWVDLMEKPRHGEAPHLVKTIDEKTKQVNEFWRTPYLDRIRGCLIIYLNHGIEERNYILAGMKAGIPWRGDSIEFYKRIVDEHENMIEMGVGKYRKQSIRLLKSMTPQNTTEPVKHDQARNQIAIDKYHNEQHEASMNFYAPLEENHEETTPVDRQDSTSPDENAERDEAALKGL